MADTSRKGDKKTLLEQFRTSDHWAVSTARDILWVVAVVGGLALTLYLICGTWPAVVTIESESMVPHMNVGDLVVLVQKDRFGELQAWDEAKGTGYRCPACLSNGFSRLQGAAVPAARGCFLHQSSDP